MLKRLHIFLIHFLYVLFEYFSAFWHVYLPQTHATVYSQIKSTFARFLLFNLPSYTIHIAYLLFFARVKLAPDSVSVADCLTNAVLVKNTTQNTSYIKMLCVNWLWIHFVRHTANKSRTRKIGQTHTCNPPDWWMVNLI